MISDATFEREFITRIQWGPKGNGLSVYTNLGLKRKMFGAEQQAFEGVLIAGLQAAKKVEDDVKKVATNG